MRIPGRWTLRLVLGMAALALPCCGGRGRTPPSKETVLPLLQKEAETLKNQGEHDVDPSLGVKITWNLKSVDVKEQPGNEAQPWRGSIRFEIVSVMEELDKPVTHRFDKDFDYAWDMDTGSWIPL